MTRFMSAGRLASAACLMIAIASPAPSHAEGDWWPRVSAEISAAEYRITWQDAPDPVRTAAAWHAVNRAQEFRVFFDDEGLRVLPRRTAADWSLRLGLARPEACGATSAVLSAEEQVMLHAEGATLEYRRSGITEQFENTSGGLHYRLELTQMATAAGDLILPIAGNAVPRPSEDGKAVVFSDPLGRPVLHYGPFVVRDPAGAELPARVFAEANDGERRLRLRLLVDGAGVVYPLTVEASITGPGFSVEGDQDGAQFGAAVGTAGDVNGDGYSDLVVGAPLYDNGQIAEGRAFLFLGSASGPSTLPAWTGEGDQAEARYGAAALAAGDVNGDGFGDLLIGAPGFDNGETDEGRAYLYSGSAAGLLATPLWVAESDNAGARFGAVTAPAGDLNGDSYADVIVGAPSFDNGVTDQGAAFVFHGSAAGPSPTADWTVEGGTAGGALGTAAVTAGDVDGDGYADVIVGAPGDPASAGRTFLYRGSPLGLSVVAAWTATGAVAGARFGGAVGPAGDVNGDGYADVMVGAATEVPGGAAHVFHGSAGMPTTVPDWSVTGDDPLGRFGVAVAPAGDVNGDGHADVIIGDDLRSAGAGRASIFLGSPSGLSVIADETFDGQPAGGLGAAVHTAGDIDGDGYSDVVVGEAGYASGSGGFGRALAFQGGPRGVATTAAWTAEADQEAANFAHSVATAGDVNDGYDDVIVGADFFDNGQTDEGRAYVYHGSAAGLGASPVWTAESDQAGANFGHVVAPAGDVNGDGYDDVIVSAYFFDNGQTDEGRAYVYHGSPSGLDPSPAWTAESDQGGAFFGARLYGAGDVNGDGYADVVIGALLYDEVLTDRGAAFVYHGSPVGLSLAPQWTGLGAQQGATFGVDVSTAGDVNGDGYSDIIVGAFGFDNGQFDEGRALVFRGSASGLEDSASWTAEGDQFGALFGHSVASAGDVNGDGYSDVVVGSIFYQNGESREGAAFAYHGSAEGLSTTPAWVVEGNQVGMEFSFPVANAGDVNGDGYSDVIVGGYLFDNGEIDEGRAALYTGSAVGLSPQPAWSAEGDDAGAEFGFIVDTAGDVNGDGYADLIVGAHKFTGDQTDEGRAFVYYGNGGPGTTLRPRQRRGDDTAPVSRLGRSGDPVAFRLAATGRSAFGRARVRLEWEVRPLGLPPGGVVTQQDISWSDTGTDGVELSRRVDSLDPGALYHWRARLHNDPTAVPWQPAGRWFTRPWNGLQEADLRTSPVTGAGRVPDGKQVPGVPLSVTPSASAGFLTLNWSASCLPTDNDYAIYSGTLSSFASHVPMVCSTGGATEFDFPLEAGSRYYLVVPRNEEAEGSHGADSDGQPRPGGPATCLPRADASCG